MSTNTLDIADRIRIGKEAESRIIDALNAQSPVVGGAKLSEFVPANTEDDKYNKIDAWCFASGHGLDGMSVQVKYRESGRDLGVAMIRPYVDIETLKYQVERDVIPWDRDMVNMPDYYAYGVGESLIVAAGVQVKKFCNMMLQKALDEEFCGNTFNYSKYPGAQLKITTDKGDGYSRGHRKMICYIESWLLVETGGWIGNF
jgi:hypothetical protein